jgi:hypothetical protein
MKPSGIIQKPRTGRKPRIPQKISRTPMNTRAIRERGRGMCREPRTSFPVV